MAPGSSPSRGVSSTSGAQTSKGICRASSHCRRRGEAEARMGGARCVVVSVLADLLKLPSRYGLPILAGETPPAAGGPGDGREPAGLR